MSYIYFIKAEETNKVKIGVATDVESRLASLQTSCPFKLKLEAKIQSEHPTLLERTLHYNLKDNRLQGEWFNLDDKHLRTIIDKAIGGNLKGIGEHLQGLIDWFKERPCLALKCLERHAELPPKTLDHFVAGRRTLNNKHLDKLIPLLKKYGLENKDLDY